MLPKVIGLRLGFSKALSVDSKSKNNNNNRFSAIGLHATSAAVKHT